LFYGHIKFNTNVIRFLQLVIVSDINERAKKKRNMLAIEWVEKKHLLKIEEYMGGAEGRKVTQKAIKVDMNNKLKIKCTPKRNKPKKGKTKATAENAMNENAMNEKSLVWKNQQEQSNESARQSESDDDGKNEQSASDDNGKNEKAIVLRPITPSDVHDDIDFENCVNEDDEEYINKLREECIESQTRLHEVSASGNHLLIPAITQYGETQDTYSPNEQLGSDVS
jgi:hypothetical protein